MIMDQEEGKERQVLSSLCRSIRNLEDGARYLELYSQTAPGISDPAESSC